MKAKITKSGKIYIINIIQGGQSFLLNYRGTKRECLWYAKMFRLALKAHNSEIIKKKNDPK